MSHPNVCERNLKQALYHQPIICQTFEGVLICQGTDGIPERDKT